MSSILQETSIMIIEELPEILTVKHIAEYLSLSRKTVYELLKLKPEAGGIPNWDAGSSKRVDKADFIKWKEEQKQKKANTWHSGTVQKFGKRKAVGQ